MQNIVLTQPDLEDGMAVSRLVASCPPLDTNSGYCNFLQCGHFLSTSVAAKLDDELVGFISGYLVPERPDTLFIWQVAVSTSVRGQGLASDMLQHILDRTDCKGVHYIETTITQDNLASWALFEAFSNKLSAEMTSSVWLKKEQHFEGEHPSESLVRIGPFNNQPVNHSGEAMQIFADMESEVQSYARSFPRIFNRAKGEFMWDEFGNRYLDFLAGAGTLNYGHNNDLFKQTLLDYIKDDGITHGLDMHTKAKGEFLHTFNDKILKPRGMEYVMQFTGPTGTNAVEAAMKIARNVTGQQNIVTFTNGFHGVSLGALAATGNSHHRNAAGVSLSGIHRMPFDGYLGDNIDTTEYLDKVLSDSSSGINSPAAVIVETVQGEGGINTASIEWLRNLQTVCRKHGILLIVDDIQAGCGRTGDFFSFEEAGIEPDIITLSKSLGGYGLPLAVVLMKPELDQWKPGEHNGTFRGNNLAFVAAKSAIDHYWSDNKFSNDIKRKGRYITERLTEIVEKYGTGNFNIKGRGLFQGINCVNGEIAGKITKAAFAKGVIIETSGADDHIVKFFCPLTISDDNLRKGIDIVESAIKEVCAKTDDIPESVVYFEAS
ncbi:MULTISPECIES: diaminobutyrate--2-oxoglutarate transaminase [unclassified Motilimonas]|uniref:diaminobutyrate--2-oxoglutarate transaminase n=1 Tax=Motilimonas TaxID=1914248 RepID=UPI001E555947|nr:MULTISPECIES: diaminobutyrate--2-oxoglutarate transaminase [unclassified Motilimonas]MDO6525344.1 diaminobutyrate--2-oxoglutarate transaminase [Motilimonas sp. 1_MG-2023]